MKTRVALLACLAACAHAASTFFFSGDLPAGRVGKAYTGGPLAVEGGGMCPRNNTSVRLVGGQLPPGLYLAPSGQFAGAPMEAGRFEFIVRAENDCGWSDRQLSIEVTAAPVLLMNPASLEYRIIAGQSVEPAAVRITSNVAGLAYSVESSDPAWIRVRSREGRTPRPGSPLDADVADVTLDTARLPVGTHRGWLRASAWRSAESASVAVTVNVLAGGQHAQPEPAAQQSRYLPEASVAPTIAIPPAAAVEPAHSKGEPHRAAAPGQHKPPTRRAAPAATPGRLSRSAQLRGRYLASKAQTAAHQPEPHDKPADPHAKPSPSSHAAPAQAKPADAHAKPADAHAKPADAHGKPADAHGKPADAHGKPAPAAKSDSHAKSDGGHGKSDHGAAQKAPAKDAHAPAKH